MENCEDSSDSGEKDGSSATWGRDHVEAEESIIGDDRSRNEHGNRILTMKRTAETNGLPRLRHREKKAMQRYVGRQLRHKELPSKFDTSESKPRIKSMRRKITKKSHRGVVPNRYFNGDSERSSEMIGSATVSSLRSRKSG